MIASPAPTPDPPLAAAAEPPRWTVEIGRRMRRLFWLKLTGTTAFTGLFFIAYFELLRHPSGPVTAMPLTALDQWIGFQPAALPAYLSLWLYLGLAPGLQRDFRDLVVYGLWIGALCVTGLAIFYAWPTAVPALAPADLGHPGFRALQAVDAAGNACPSMHVAVAIFTALRLEPLLRHARAPLVLRLANLAWFAAIAWSTLATKQHVALDVAAGALLGAAFAFASLWHGARRRRAAAAAPARADIIERMSTDIAP